MLNMNAGRPARLHYLLSSYRVLSQGDHVLCAVTGARIPLDRLRYWSSDLQEAYASAEIATRRYEAVRSQGRL